jgi:hypothetical protein
MAPYYARIRADARMTAVACGIRNGWLDGSRQLELEQSLAGVPIKFVNGSPYCGGPTFGTDMQLAYPLGCYHPKERYEEVATIDFDQCPNLEDWCTDFLDTSTMRDIATHETIHAIAPNQCHSRRFFVCGGHDYSSANDRANDAEGCEP